MKNSIYPQRLNIKRVCALLLILIGNTVHAETGKLRAQAEHLKNNIQSIFDFSEQRNHLNTHQLDRIADNLYSKMQEYRIPCKKQSYVANQQNYHNMVCRLDAKKNKDVIVGAHYDSHANTPGADDNASGVVGVLETARLLSLQRQQLTHNVEFVFYTLEEPPYFRTELMGSAVHAESILPRKNQIDGVYILEMIGYFSEQPIQEYPFGLGLFYPQHGNFIAAIANFNSGELSKNYCKTMRDLKQLDCQRLTAPSFVQGVDFSDHLNYWKYDIPAIMITDTSFYRNKNYHELTDTIDTLNFDHMADVVDGMVNVLIQPKQIHKKK